MSALTPAGSTRQWRRIRRRVLARDRWTCRVPVNDDGTVCGDRAVTVGHIVRRMNGGTDDLANLRAECGYHNYRDGALARHGKPDRPTYREKGWL